jgi:hypothetical protein
MSELADRSIDDREAEKQYHAIGAEVAAAQDEVNAQKGIAQ